MHLRERMAPRMHLLLRVGALAVLVAVGVWPRSRPATREPAQELARTPAPDELGRRERAAQLQAATVDVAADVNEFRLTN